jgi:hypothetical protein
VAGQIRWDQRLLPFAIAIVWENKQNRFCFFRMGSQIVMIAACQQPDNAPEKRETNLRDVSSVFRKRKNKSRGLPLI